MCAHARAHPHAYTHTPQRSWSNESFNRLPYPSVSYRHAQHTLAHTLSVWSIHIKNVSHLNIHIRRQKMAGRPLSLPPVSLSLSRYINNSPCLSTTQSWRFFPSDKVSRSFYKLIRVCSLWSRQLWTGRIDLAGEPAVPDHDFKQNPMFLWRSWPSPEQYLY